jgi:DNA gyrase/topoisomerase IV subunit A
MRGAWDDIPDLRDGLTRRERAVLFVMRQLQEERGPRAFATAEIYGRVCEHVEMSVEELQATLVRLGAGSRAGDRPARTRLCP